MPTEVMRLGEDYQNSVVLTGDIPYIAIKEKTKTGSPRRRLIPIVLGVELLTEHLREGVQWLNSNIDPSTPSQTLSKRIRAATGNPALSTHCLRHTWRTMADMAEINVTHQAYIGGWAHAHKKAKFSDSASICIRMASRAERYSSLSMRFRRRNAVGNSSN